MPVEIVEEPTEELKANLAEGGKVLTTVEAEVAIEDDQDIEDIEQLSEEILESLEQSEATETIIGTDEDIPEIDFYNSEEGIEEPDQILESFPLEIENVAEIFSQVIETIEELEPVEAEIVHELADEIAVSIRELQIEIAEQELDFELLPEEKVEELQALVIEVFEHIGLDCNEEQAKQLIRFWLENQDFGMFSEDIPGLDLLFSNLGTYEGRRYFGANVDLPAPVSSVHNRLGKLILSNLAA